MRRPVGCFGLWMGVGYVSVQTTLDPGLPLLTQGRCLVHGQSPMPRRVPSPRCVQAGVSRGIMEKVGRCGTLKTGQNPAGWRGMGRGWVAGKSA